MIEVNGLTKVYGDTVAVDHVTLHVGAGEIVGLVGCNGAGKTTTMRILTSYAAATSGNAYLAGYHVFRDSAQVRRIVGYLAEDTPLYPDVRVGEYLMFRARLKDVPACLRKRRVAECMDRCGLRDVARRIVGQLSKGYRRRLGLAEALVGDPRILILDEPTLGLDPNQVSSARALIRELGETRTVLLSTHYLPEVEMICGRTVIIDKGRIIADAPTGELMKQSGRDERLEDVFMRLTAEGDRAAGEGDSG